MALCVSLLSNHGTRRGGSDEAGALGQTQTWERICRDVDQVADKLGKPVDRGIKETVAALWANGIPTSTSCEGHLDRAYAYPWVRIGWPERSGHTNSESALERSDSDLRAIESLSGLLEEFYRDSVTPPEDRLAVRVWK